MNSYRIIRRTVLLVSLRVQTREPEGARVLCAGHVVEVTSLEEKDETLCVLLDGSEVWIDRRYLV